MTSIDSPSPRNQWCLGLIRLCFLASAQWLRMQRSAGNEDVKHPNSGDVLQASTMLSDDLSGRLARANHAVEHRQGVNHLQYSGVVERQSCQGSMRKAIAHLHELVEIFSLACSNKAKCFCEFGQGRPLSLWSTDTGDFMLKGAKSLYDRFPYAFLENAHSKDGYTAIAFAAKSLQEGAKFVRNRVQCRGRTGHV